MKKKVMLREKLLRVSIVLIALFTATIFFVTDNKVNNLVDKNVSAKLNSISDLGLDIIKSKYGGEWSVKDGKLFIGQKMLNNNFEVVDALKEKTGSLATLYLGKERVVTSILDKDGERTVGYAVPDDVAEVVLKKGDVYEGTESILGDKYAVKYVPIKNSVGKVIGMWSVGMPKSNNGSQGNNILVMRASIVLISVICGILGCIVLLLYTKKFLKGIDTLKVAFLESGSNNKKTQKKVLMMSLLLISTFFLIWFIIQGYTIGNVVSRLEDNNIKDRINTNAELGNMLLEEQYSGSWSVESNILFKGIYSLNNNYSAVDKISLNSEFVSAFYMGDTMVATSIKSEDGTRPVGTKAPNKIIETVLKQGNEYVGETTVHGKKCVTKYMPLKDINGKIIGMWTIGIEKIILSKHITNLRKAITQISMVAILIAFTVFLYLSIVMVSDIKNFNVSLHTNIN